MKKVPAALFCFFLMHGVIAQNLFQKIYKIREDSLPYGASLYSLFQTPDEGYIAVGTNPSGWPNAAIVTLKLDHQGDLEWANSLDSANDYRNTLAQDGGLVYATSMKIVRTDVNGNIVWVVSNPLWSVFSYTKKIISLKDGGFVVASLSGLIAKLDANGTLIWCENIFLNTDLQSITTDDNSNIIILDKSNITELNASGVPQWKYCVGCYLNIQMEYITTSRNGDFVVCGKLNSFPRTAFIFEIDPSGYIKWYKNYRLHGSNGISGEDVIQTPDHGLAMLARSGYTWGDSAATIIKTDSVGNVIWAETFDFASANGMTRSSTLVKTNDNGLLLSSVISEWNSPTNATTYKTYFCFTKIDRNGHAAECSLTSSTNDLEIIMDTSFQVINFGASAVPATASSAQAIASFTATTFPVYNCSDFSSAVIPDGTLYPNPNNGQFTLEIGETSEEGQLEVFDMLGQKIGEMPFPSSTTYSFDLSFLDTGVYFLKVTDVNMPEKGRWAGKVIIAW